MNPFQAIPANVRKWIYLAYGLAGLFVSSVAAYCASVDQSVPKWAIGASAVLVGPLAAAFGATAAANVVPVVAAADEDSPTGEVAGPESDLPTGTPTVTNVYGSELGDPHDDLRPRGYGQGV